MNSLPDAEMPSELYTILETCTSEELSALVATLLKAPVSLLKLTRAYERHQPDHLRYTDQIGDEVYRLGLIALGRTGGMRPSYKEMLVGLWKKVGISSIPDDLALLESNLLNAFGKRHFLSMLPTDRQPLVEEVCSAASTAVGGLLSSNEWPPFASALMQFVYLRGKLENESRLPSISKNMIQPKRDTSSILLEGASVKTVVGVESGDALLLLESIPAANDVEWHKFGELGKILDLLNPILKAAQPLLSAQEVLNNGTYVKAVLKKGQSLSVDKLGRTVGAAKGTKGQVEFISAGAATLAGPAALLILAVAIQEQRRWENLERSLIDIKLALGDISKFQKDERRSILTGSLRYFQQIASSVFSGELAEEILHGIERHEVELLRTQEHIAEEIRTQTSALRSTKNDSWLSTTKFVKALGEGQAVLEAMYDEMLLCIRTRACGYQLLCAFPGRDAGKKARLEDIRKSLAIYVPTGEASVAIDQVLRERIQNISSYDVKMEILKRENALLERAEMHRNYIMEGIDLFHQNMAEDTMSIEIKVEDGQAVAMRTV